MNKLSHIAACTIVFTTSALAAFPSAVKANDIPQSRYCTFGFECGFEQGNTDGHVDGLAKTYHAHFNAAYLRRAIRPAEYIKAFKEGYSPGYEQGWLKGLKDCKPKVKKFRPDLRRQKIPAQSEFS